MKTGHNLHTRFDSWLPFSRKTPLFWFAQTRMQFKFCALLFLSWRAFCCPLCVPQKVNGQQNFADQQGWCLPSCPCCHGSAWCEAGIFPERGVQHKSSKLFFFPPGKDPVHLELHKLGTNMNLDETLLSVIAHIVFHKSGCVSCIEPHIYGTVELELYHQKKQNIRRRRSNKM